MFLDIGIGIFTAIFTSYLFKIQLSMWLLLFSIFCAIAPDADFIFFYLKRHDTKYDYKHRDLIHYPLLFLPIGTFLIWLFFGKIYGLAFFIASFLHFIHDSIGIGWGIKWLYPFSRNNYAFFHLYSSIHNNGLRKPIFAFSEKELPAIVEKHGDPNWVKNIYFKWHPIAIIELSGFIISVLLLILYYFLK